MVPDVQQASDLTRVTMSLRELVGDVDAGNGTPLAAALSVALIRDAQAMGHHPSDVLRIDKSVLLDAARHLRRGLNSGRHDFELPMGSAASSLHPGGISIAGEALVLDAGREGLHPLEATRRDAHGPNLELLRTSVERYTRRLACRRIGLPSARTIVGTEKHTMLQFPPFAMAGGLVLRRPTSDTGAPLFCSATTNQIERLAMSIVEDMRALWRRRVELARHAERIHQLTETAILAECGRDAGMRVTCISIDLASERRHGDPSAYVEYDALDDALRPGPVVEQLPRWEGTTIEDLKRVPRSNRSRSARRKELRALGADGRIDDVAAAIAAAAPGGAAAILAELAGRQDALVTIPTSGAPLYATLYWCDGTIKAEAICRRRLDYHQGRLALREVRLSEAVFDTVKGRRLSDLAELPFPCECRITSAQVAEEGIVLDLEVGTSLVDCAEGRVWPETSPEPPPGLRKGPHLRAEKDGS